MARKIDETIIARAKEMKRRGMTNSAISKILGIGKRTVIRHTAWLGPRCFMGVRRELPSHAADMSADKAGIHAYLIAEGDLKASKPKRNESYRRKIFEFWNSSPILLRDFVEHVKRVYKYEPRIDRKRGRVEIKRAEVARDLLRYGPYGSKLWTIPDGILNAGVETRTEWVRCYSDSEGHVSISKNEIVLKSVNFSGLKKVRHLLESLGITSRINGPYSGAYKLVISRKANLRKYRNSVGFMSPEKQSRLDNLLQ